METDSILSNVTSSDQVFEFIVKLASRRLGVRVSLMIATASHYNTIVSASILEAARVTAEDLDWLSITEDQRIIDDETLDMITGASCLVEDMDKENDEPVVKRSKIEEVCSVKLSTNSRFDKLTASPELAKSSKGFVPCNTECNTQWAVRTFTTRMEWRNSCKPEDPVPQDILTSSNAEALNKWLSLFILEARKKEGSKYPTTTLNLLLCGLKRHMLKLNSMSPNFLDEKNPQLLVYEEQEIALHGS